MLSSKEKRLPKKKEGENLNGYQRLHNEVLQVLETLNVGWSPYSVDTIGASYLSQLVASLWYLDTHHETLADRGLHLPKELAHLHGFNQWQKKKIKKPQMTVEGLEDHIRNLCHFTSQPWLSKSQYSVLKVITEALSNIMYNYKEYLLKQRDRIQERHQRVEPSRSAIENVEMRTYEAQIGPVSKSYCHLFKYMETLEFYEEVCLDKFSPEERYTRRHWIDGISLPFPIMMYRFPYGNNLGVVSFVWKVPPQGGDQTSVARLITKLTNKQDIYSTRHMRREFLDQYKSFVKIPKIILRNMYRTLTGDSSAAETTSQREIDERFLEALSLDDPDILVDLRKLNGNSNSRIFDTFWNELDDFVNELSPVVDDRRHSSTLHMPVAISLHHLKNTIEQRLQQKFPGQLEKQQCPSLEWIRLQFWPPNPFASSALRYTAKFNLKFGVQIRQLRHTHPDSHYVSVLLKYVKEFSVRFRNVLRYVSVDDKAIIPVGEPGMPVSSGVRGHNKSIVPLNGQGPVALDHDYHVCGIVPSVSFFVEVPELPSDSFYNGKAFVACKDTVSYNTVFCSTLQY